MNSLLNSVILNLPLLKFYFCFAMIDNFMLIAFTEMTYKKRERNGLLRDVHPHYHSDGTTNKNKGNL